MALITVNTRKFKTAKPPERLRTDVKSVQTADEIVTGYPEVSQRELGAVPATVPLAVKQGAGPVITTPHCVPMLLKKTEERIGSTTTVGFHSSDQRMHSMG